MSKTHLKKLDFLIGAWHTQGKLSEPGSKSPKEIRGMDTYAWIADGFFILHHVDVFMGNERVEVVEIIGYEASRKSYFMKSFDNQGVATTMYAILEKPGVLQLGDQNMRAVLKVSKNGRAMSAEWELSDKGKIWKPWMLINFIK